ncbi:hypothetical protein [Advenella mimigardefordensis]|uniref:Uncharacterized protein n=1 Tax=Advenella mimigardefordensis (strain DSM 17166 / LMG 22922 / DPN7) TaxID=1247726 RepID=W0PJF7_ADVMD|nr:hypothetical protein [Advenella mimigardefordensis]AHG66167.1 hypothetical protein MIM_24p00040 [Advenella mimigardefordensis DPN7]
MKATKILVGSIMIFALGTSPAIADEAKPFGFKMGMSEKEILEALKNANAGAIKADPTLIISRSAVIPLKGYSSYLYVFTKKSGLCKISALSENFSSGLKLRQEYDTIKNNLITKYGKPAVTFDSDNRTDTSKDILDAMKNGEINLATSWGETVKRHPDGSFYFESIAPLPKNLKAVVLNASAENNRLGGSSGSVAITYKFANESECLSEITGSTFNAL